MYLLNIYMPLMHFLGSHYPQLQETKLQEEVEWFIQSYFSPTSQQECLEEIHQQQAGDSICSKLTTYLTTGWPNKHSLPHSLKHYWTVRGELSLHEGLLLYGNHIVIPTSLQKQILQRNHHGNQGIQKCRLRISMSAWWPGISEAIKTIIKNCSQGVKCCVPPKEPLLTSPLLGKPQQKVTVVDLLELNKAQYLIVIQISGVVKLSGTTSSSVINTLKSIFARRGIPTELITDNGTNLVLVELNIFIYLFISARNKQPQIPPKQWHGGESSGNSQKTATECSRSTHYSPQFPCNSNLMVLTEPSRTLIPAPEQTSISTVSSQKLLNIGTGFHQIRISSTQSPENFCN